LIEINLDDHYISWMASSFSCRGDNFPVKYLRLPISANLCRLSTWKPIISNIRSRLALWKGIIFEYSWSYQPNQVSIELFAFILHVNVSCA
jgi:hypothetical protein